MAFPYIFESNFEIGTTGEWDVGEEVDTASQLDVASYRELARFPKMSPYRGAYCLRAVLSGGTADAFVYADAINGAADATVWTRFSLYFSDDFTATATDVVHLLEFQGAADAIQAVFGFSISDAGVITLGIGELTPATLSSIVIEKGKWHTIELHLEVDAGGGNDGSIDIYVTPEGQPASTTIHAAQVGSLDQIAITHGVLGPQNHLATTTGTILFDEFAVDELRLYPIRERYPETRQLTKTGSVFVGNGCIDSISIVGGGNDSEVVIYDTDAGVAEAGLDASSAVARVRAGAANQTEYSHSPPIYVTHGAFAVLNGTDPRASVHIGRASGYSSPGAVRNHGLR